MSSDHNKKKKMEPLYIDGFPLPRLKWFKEENMRAAMNYRAQDDDIILCSYPKTGTNWVTYIIWEILHKGAPYLRLRDANGEAIPFLEVNGIAPVEAMDKPRFYKHHFPFNRIKTNPKAKYVYIHRNPEDALVSYYHFAAVEYPDKDNLDFEEFFEDYINGQMPYASYFDHVLSYEAHRKDGNILFVRYENLKKDSRKGILEIAKFLGNEYYKNFLEDKSSLDRVVEVTSFDYMKKNVDSTMPHPDGGDRKVEMFRKGVVGDGKNKLTKEQMVKLKETMMAKMHGTVYADMWS